MDFILRTRPELVPEAKATKLGTVAGERYIALKNREFIVAGEVERNDTRAGGTYLVVPVEERDDDGAILQVASKLHHLIEVERGAFEKAQARRRATGPRPAMLVDALSLPALSAKPPFSLPPPGTKALAPSLGNRLTGVVEGSGKVRSRDLIPFLEGKGIHLELHDGALLVTAEGGRMLTTLREVVEIAERLLVGYLSGEPVLCELPHRGTPPEAWSIALGGLAMCRECASAPRQSAGAVAA